MPQVSRQNPTKSWRKSHAARTCGRGRRGYSPRTWHASGGNGRRTFFLSFFLSRLRYACLHGDAEQRQGGAWLGPQLPKRRQAKQAPDAHVPLRQGPAGAVILLAARVARLVVRRQPARYPRQALEAVAATCQPPTSLRAPAIRPAHPGSAGPAKSGKLWQRESVPRKASEMRTDESKRGST
jgi:hypothetical protein